MPYVHTASGTGTAQDRLDLARALEARILSGVQEYDMEGNRLKLPDLEVVVARIKSLEAEVAAAAVSPSSAGTNETKVYFKRPL